MSFSIPFARWNSVRVRLTLGNVAAMALLLLVLGATLRQLALSRLEAALDDQLIDQAQHLLVGGPPPHGPDRHDNPQNSPPHDHGDNSGPDNHNPDQNAPSLNQQGSGPPGFDNGPHSPRQHGFTPPETIAASRTLRQMRRGVNTGDTTSTFLLTRFITPDGLDHGPSGRIDPPWDKKALQTALQGVSAFSTLTVDGERVRVYSTPRRRHGRVEGVVQSAATLTEMHQEVDRISRSLISISPFALLGVALTGAFLTGRALRPVTDLTKAVERIEARNLSDRLPLTGGDEFTRLAGTFNAMLDRLEQAFAQQKRFTADASHELRTPLTIIKSNASLALSADREAESYRRSLVAVNEAADMMTHLVENLLVVARSDAANVAVDWKPVLVDDLLTIVVRTLRDPESAPITLDIEDSSLTIFGDRYDLMRLFTNLLTNARRHTPPDGQIHVLADRDTGGAILISVSDTGEGIDTPHLPHVFEAFYRVDASRTRSAGGTGLGLPICKSIVEAHGGSITLKSIRGRGTVVSVRLPQAVETNG